VLSGTVTAAVAAASLILGGLTAALGRLAGGTAGQQEGPSSGRFVAFDAVCPHAGCSVGYDPSAKVIVCPCHGSQFNASTGAVEVGPAPTGLKKLGAARGPNGQLYVT
jgi:thiosulfate dehydrogenase (quinone) large subunit